MNDLSDNLLLWLDLETTGSDEAHDSIIEVGCVLTTSDLVEISAVDYLVKPEPEGLGRLLQNPVVRRMHSANGLLDLILAGDGIRPHESARDLLAWLTLNGAEASRTVLAGSGVGHFDRRFLKRWMPQVDRFLRYWPIDMSTIRRAHAMWVGTTVSNANDAKTHRALDDARCHLDEARAFRALWLGVPAA